MALELNFIGHASFLLSANDVQWLADPYDDHVGYPVMKLAPDMVTVSHGHHDHNDVSALEEGYQLVDQTGEGEAAGLKWRCVETFHDDEQGAKRGVNRVYIVKIGGYTVAHLGDLGHALDEATVAAIGKVDILMIPVGGFYTIDAKEAARITEQIGAPVTIAMHYNYDGKLTLPIADESEFLALTGGKAVPFCGMNFEGPIKGRHVYAFRAASMSAATE